MSPIEEASTSYSVSCLISSSIKRIISEIVIIDCECDEEIDILSNSDCLDLLDDCIGEDDIQDNSLVEGDEIQSTPSIEDLDELALLGFFREFTLMDIGIDEFIREIYFED